MSTAATELLYFYDQTLTTSKARVKQINLAHGGLAVILDQTVFYVQGGGQPGDRGTISSQDSAFSVQKTFRDADGSVVHLGQFTKGEPFPVESEVHLEVDKVVRQEHTRLHSAGHLIHLAVWNTGLQWDPCKSCHFPGACCVEYNIENSKAHDDVQALQVQIQQEFDRLVQADLAVMITIEGDAANGRYGLPLRQISFAGKAQRSCGGTHVPSTLHLHGITITKLKIKNGICKVNYQ